MLLKKVPAFRCLDNGVLLEAKKSLPTRFTGPLFYYISNTTVLATVSSILLQSQKENYFRSIRVLKKKHFLFLKNLFSFLRLRRTTYEFVNMKKFSW